MLTNHNNISISRQTDFELKKLAEIVGESKASVVKNLIYLASQDNEWFESRFHIIKLARLGLKPLRHSETPNQ